MAIFYLHMMVLIDPMLQWMKFRHHHMLKVNYRANQTRLDIETRRRFQNWYHRNMLVSRHL